MTPAKASLRPACSSHCGVSGIAKEVTVPYICQTYPTKTYQNQFFDMNVKYIAPPKPTRASPTKSTDPTIAYLLDGMNSIIRM